MTRIDWIFCWSLVGFLNILDRNVRVEWRFEWFNLLKNNQTNYFAWQLKDNYDTMFLLIGLNEFLLICLKFCPSTPVIQSNYKIKFLKIPIKLLFCLLFY